MELQNLLGNIKFWVSTNDYSDMNLVQQLIDIMEKYFNSSFTLR